MRPRRSRQRDLQGAVTCTNRKTVTRAPKLPEAGDGTHQMLVCGQAEGQSRAECAVADVREGLLSYSVARATAHLARLLASPLRNSQRISNGLARRHCLYAPGNSRGRIRDGRHAAERAPLWAGHSLSR